MSTAELTTFDPKQVTPKLFELDMEAVEKTITTYALMTIKDRNDKAGYKALKDARLELRSLRVKIEKRGKAMREDSTAYSKKVLEVEKALIAKIEPTEKLLDGREKAIDNEIKEIAAAKLKARMYQLAAYDSVIPATAIEPMSENEFAECLEYSKGLYEERQEEIRLAKEAEAKRLADEAAAKAAEAQRMQAERETLEAERRRLEELRKAQEAIQAAEQAKFRAEQEEHARKIKVQQDAIDAENEKLVEAKRKAEAEAAEQRRQQELEQARQEAAEQARKDEAARIERKRILDAEAAGDARKEAIRRESLAPDREKLLRLAVAIEALPFPVVSTEAQNVLNATKSELLDTADRLRGLVETL